MFLTIYINENICFTLGKKDISSTLLPTRDKSQPADENFESMPVIPGMQPQEHGASFADRNGKNTTVKPLI